MTEEASSKPENELSREIELVSKTKANSLLDLVLQGKNLGLTKAQALAHSKLAKLHVTMQPNRLRVCSVECPMHSSCVYITDIPKGSEPYGLRCPHEADYMQIAYDTNVEMVKSIDPDYDPLESLDYDIPSFEKGICMEIAFYSVVEYRLSVEIASSPEATVQTALVGTMGEYRTEENPAYNSWIKAGDRKGKYQDRLQKAVEARLKRVVAKEEMRLTTIKMVQKTFTENREKLEGTAYHKIFNLADKATSDIVAEQNERAGIVEEPEESNEEDRGDGSEPDGEISS